MQQLFRGSQVYLILFVTVVIVSLSSFYGCDDAGVEVKSNANPNLRKFDSIWVQETVDSSSYCGMNLFNGTTVIRDSVSKDCQLIDSLGSGLNFYLRSGDLSDLNLPIGFQMRFNRIYASMSQTQFDTITVLPVNRDSIITSLDFTEDDTKAWGYWNANLSGDQPVYSFWLKGKSESVQGKNIFGIMQPIQSIDIVPGSVGGYAMSFRVKINTGGVNNFSDSVAVGN